MERKIGETFEYEGKKLKVTEYRLDTCESCFFDEHCTRDNKALAGKCGSNDRDDGKNVIFVEVQEQPQELNLCEVLKYCPQGETFWSPLLNDVKMHHVRQEAERVSVISKSGAMWDINADGTITISGETSPEVMLFPGKEQRDWTNVKYEPKKERFNPKTLKPFDRVIIRNVCNVWTCTLFSHISNKPDSRYIYVTCESVHKYCIPTMTKPNIL